MDIREEVLEMKKEVKDIQEHSFAMELLKDQKKQNKRQFIIILVILGMFTCLLGYTIWLLNDIGVETTTTESYDMSTENGNNNFIGRDNYGNDRETEKSFDKMLQSLEDFTYLIMQEADSQDKIEKVRKTARKISEM